MKKITSKKCHFIYPNQLSHSLRSLQELDKSKDCVLFLEIKEEWEHVAHHKTKLTFILSAMRHFAKELKAKGYQVDSIQLNDSSSTSSYTEALETYVKQHHIDEVIVTEPYSFHLANAMKTWTFPYTCFEDERFFATHKEFALFAKGKKKLTLEHFYRKMRKKHKVLLDTAGKPLGGKWNFDQENRQPYDKKIPLPQPKKTKPDAITKEVQEQVETYFPSHMGTTKNFFFAVTEKQAKMHFSFFLKHLLPHFGTYQDAMSTESPFLFHSLISGYLNVGLLLPQDVVEAVAKAKAPLNAKEAFIRQILGWREFIRGIYWLMGPDYEKKNFFGHQRPLPSFYWTADTSMNCLKQALSHTRDHAYSHHIQRLMITGNFALLAQLSPQEVCNWYLAVYFDAFEWVELPNTLGMALFADGGVFATKPYIAGGNYISKMSNFCKTCPYSPKERLGDKACPFTFLYWNFLIEKKELLSQNPRMRLAYQHVEKMSNNEQKELQEQAKNFLNKKLT